MPQIEPMPIEKRYPYLRRMHPRYRAADRQAKGRLLDEMMTPPRVCIAGRAFASSTVT